QRLGTPRFLAGDVGERSHHPFSSEESVGGLSATYIHDVRSRCGGRESGERMARAETNRTAVALERQAIAQGHRLRTAAAAASALACRCFLYQPVGHV